MVVNLFLSAFFDGEEKKDLLLCYYFLALLNYRDVVKLQQMKLKLQKMFIPFYN